MNSLSLKANYEGLLALSLPALVHLKLRHYCVLYFVSELYCIVAEPRCGIIWYFRREFELLWSDYLIVFDDK